MRLSIALLLASSAVASAFTTSNLQRVPTAFNPLLLRMSSETAPIVVTGNNIDVTDALKDYVNEKMGRTLGKLSSSGEVKVCDVHLSVNKNPSVKEPHKAEVTTTLKGVTIRSSETSPDMYASIDNVSDRLARKLRKYKERRLDGFHGGAKMGANLADVLNDIAEEEPDIAAPVEEEYIDPGQAVVTKIKSFDLSKSISVKEAVFALDYIDHDFYVFRDDDTDEISVVYKRNAGGVGLIQPQKE